MSAIGIAIFLLLLLAGDGPGHGVLYVLGALIAGLLSLAMFGA